MIICRCARTPAAVAPANRGAAEQARPSHRTRSARALWACKHFPAAHPHHILSIRRRPARHGAAREAIAHAKVRRSG